MVAIDGLSILIFKTYVWCKTSDQETHLQISNNQLIIIDTTGEGQTRSHKMIKMMKQLLTLIHNSYFLLMFVRFGPWSKTNTSSRPTKEIFIAHTQKIVNLYRCSKTNNYYHMIYLHINVKFHFHLFKRLTTLHLTPF